MKKNNQFTKKDCFLYSINNNERLALASYHPFFLNLKSIALTKLNSISYKLKFVLELLHKHYVPTVEDTEEEIFNKLSDYCGKPMRPNITDKENPPKWDYYHSVFFVMTVVTTVGK